MDIRLSIRPEVMKLLQENIEEMVQDIEVNKDLIDKNPQTTGNKK